MSNHLTTTADPLYASSVEGTAAAAASAAAAAATGGGAESLTPPNPMMMNMMGSAPLSSPPPAPSAATASAVSSAEIANAATSAMNESYDTSLGDSGGGGGGSGSGMNGNKDEYEEIREQDRYLPIANIARIMKNTLPENAKIAKDSKETVQECVSEFISFITSEASDKCMQEKRKTINGDDLLWAMSTLGFDKYVEPLKIYLSKYREAIRGDKPDTKVGTGGGGVGGVGGSGGSTLGRPPATAANVGGALGLPTGYAAPAKGGSGFDSSI